MGQETLEFIDIMAAQRAGIVLPPMDIRDEDNIVLGRDSPDRLAGPAELASIPIVAFVVELDVTKVEAVVSRIRLILGQLLTLDQTHRSFVRPRPRVFVAVSTIPDTTGSEKGDATKREPA
jgi:hypothetical protein